MSLADIIQIIIGVLSLVATIAVSFLIYWLQSRHEKEIQKLQCEKERIALQEKARLFLIDNQEERDYLPWCIIAANLYPLEKHTRKIYSEYCRCSEELQNEILNQADTSQPALRSGSAWMLLYAWKVLLSPSLKKTISILLLCCFIFSEEHPFLYHDAPA